MTPRVVTSCEVTCPTPASQVWAMAVGAGEALLATGGADATVALWHDATEEDQAAAAAEGDAIVLRQQDLANALHVNPPTPPPPLFYIFLVQACICAVSSCVHATASALHGSPPAVLHREQWPYEAGEGGGGSQSRGVLAERCDERDAAWGVRSAATTLAPRSWPSRCGSRGGCWQWSMPPSHLATAPKAHLSWSPSPVRVLTGPSTSLLHNAACADSIVAI